MAITEFCTESIKEKAEFSRNRAILMFNFSFLLKASFAQVIFVSLANYPQAALVLLVLAELVFLAFNIGVEVKYRSLKSILFLAPRVVQSLFLMTLECFLLVSFLRLRNKKEELSESTQLKIIQLILISNFVEYAMLLLEIFLIVRSLVAHRKLLGNPSYK